MSDVKQSIGPHVYVVTAEHWSVPGLRMSAFKTPEAAQTCAVELTNALLRDACRSDDATPATWEGKVGELQEEFGAQYTYVEITQVALGD